ncbi:MAG: hypothetical protein J6O61_02285 [Butyrivibrio sp.]|uniref:hypothetical protein n=1 Tax=Butyrivibrio sp. TaxID=28121 RepID=UPI001B2BF3F4|nr:hypothetical protein [Butyrivibrio sp.]MBO6239662.1 hypothetical protein [Butyrivibrio sp.]
MKMYCVVWDREFINDKDPKVFKYKEEKHKDYDLISASSMAEAISIATAKKVIESLCYGGEFAGTLREKCGRLKKEIEIMLYDTFCEEDDWSYDDGVKYIQENIDLKYLMNQFDEGEKREIWNVCNVDDVSAYCLE